MGFRHRMRALAPALLGVMFAASVPAVSGHGTVPHGHEDEIVEGSASPVFQPVVSPPVPKHVKFAGHNYSFDRTDMYERLDRELSQMAYSHAATMLMLKRANRYFPVIVPILKANGVPEELVYLACIESTLSPTAYSPAKAAGMWQFLATTAKQYGLEVNDFVDERYNVEKATEAAARYLKDSYQKYGNWESAMASYNGGKARISKELESQQADSSFDLYLAEETTRYVYRILAAKVLMENPAKYGFKIHADQFYTPHEFKTVKVTATIDDLPAWARQQGTTYALLREFNPWLRAKSLPVKEGQTYEIKIPTEKWMSKSHSRLTAKQLYNHKWAAK